MNIRVEDCALILSVMANMMSLLFIVAAAERVSCCVGLIPKLSQGSKFDLDVVITPAPAHRNRVETTFSIPIRGPVYFTLMFRKLPMPMLDTGGKVATRSRASLSRVRDASFPECFFRLQLHSMTLTNFTRHGIKLSYRYENNLPAVQTSFAHNGMAAVDAFT